MLKTTLALTMVAALNLAWIATPVAAADATAIPHLQAAKQATEAADDTAAAPSTGTAEEKPAAKKAPAKKAPAKKAHKTSSHKTVKTVHKTTHKTVKKHKTAKS
jgi:hypothetical protein